MDKRFLACLRVVLMDEYKQEGDFDVDECECETKTEHAAHMIEGMKVRFSHLENAFKLWEQTQ